MSRGSHCIFPSMLNENKSLMAEGFVCLGLSKRTVVAAGVALLSAYACSVGSAQVASDQGSNYVSGGWTNGANAGTGFNPWVFGSVGGTGNAGVFIGDPGLAGISGMSSNSFGFYANPIGSGANAEVSRSLVSSLASGQTFSFQWGLNWDSNDINSNRGFNLRSGATQLFNLNMSASSTIRINGNLMFTNFGTQGFTINFEQISPTSMRVYGTGRNGSEVYDNTFTNLAGAADSFSFYFNATDSSINRQMYADNLSVVPEPTVLSLLLAGVAGIAYSARRRRRMSGGV